MEGEFGLVESFHIDDGQLDRLSPQECFVLGYELCSVCTTAELSEMTSPEGVVDVVVHAANKDRLEKALTKRGVKMRWKWPSDDVSEEWVYLAFWRE